MWQETAITYALLGLQAYRARFPGHLSRYAAMGAVGQEAFMEEALHMLQPYLPILRPVLSHLGAQQNGLLDEVIRRAAAGNGEIARVATEHPAWLRQALERISAEMGRRVSARVHHQRTS